MKVAIMCILCLYLRFKEFSMPIGTKNTWDAKIYLFVAFCTQFGLLAFLRHKPRHKPRHQIHKHRLRGVDRPQWEVTFYLHYMVRTLDSLRPGLPNRGSLPCSLPCPVDALRWECWWIIRWTGALTVNLDWLPRTLGVRH